MASYTRPPKPVPFGGGIAEDKLNTSAMLSSNRNNNNNDMDRSEASRDGLRRQLHKRRQTLTATETAFLEELCVRGNEIEVQIATEKLQDEELFFSDEEGGGWNSDKIQVGRETSMGSYTSEQSPNETSSDCLAEEKHPAPSSVMSDSSSMGSTRRISMLQSRRKSELLGGIWKAHENGIAISKNASRRSLLSRNHSVGSSISGSKRDLFLRQMRNEDIFRSDRGLGGRRSLAPMMDVQSDNTGRRRGRSVSMSQAKPASPTKKSLKATPRPQFRRLFSEGSRKSVTFGELPIPRRSFRRSSDESSVITSVFIPGVPPSLHHARPIRSESVSSIPSIHHAHHIHSPSSRSSLQSKSSVPSLHHGHPIRSESFPIKPEESAGESSAGSWDPYSSDDDDDDEKKFDAGVVKPVPVKVEVPEEQKVQVISEQQQLQRPVLMRDASLNTYNGQGIEVADWESLNAARKYDSILLNAETASIRSNSFDETMSFGRMSDIFRQSLPESFPRTLSSDDFGGVFLGGSRVYLRESSSTKEIRIADDDSWSIGDSEDLEYFDAWKVIEDEYVNGYGGGDTLPFLILGTSADDIGACPHVLSPPLMESLQAFMPYSKSSENFWMKYSLVRDGASMHTFLRYARGAKYTILAIETVDGEVFGAFTSEAWRKNWNYFGNGESFLWRMRHTRKERTHSIIDQAQLESEIDVYPYTGENNCIQLCTHDKIAVGGGTHGTGSCSAKALDGSPISRTEWGFGITIQEDMLHGTTSPCITFASPSLSLEHSDGSIFEIVNLELWTLTPCMRLEDAEKLELGKLFLEEHRIESN